MPGQPRYPDFRFPFHGSPCGKRASLPCQKTFSGGRSVSPGVLLCRKAGEKAIPFLTREAPVARLRAVAAAHDPFSRARRPSCPAPFGTRPGLRHVGNPDRPPFGWTRHPLAEAFLRASLVADHTAPHPGGGAAPSCARGRPFCSGGVGGCSASARRPSSRSRSRSFARWPFSIRKAALPWRRAAFIIFLRDACLAGRWPDAPPGPGAGKIRREKRRSRGCRARLRAVRAGCGAIAPAGGAVDSGPFREGYAPMFKNCLTSWRPMANAIR